MDDTTSMLGDMARRLFARELGDEVMRDARRGTWPAAAWRSMAEQGLPLALVEGEQGFGVPLSEGLDLVREIGRHAAPLPLAETMIANALLAQAGLPVGEGPVALVPESDGVTLRRTDAGWHVAGRAARIAWGRNADALLVESGGHLALVTDFRVERASTNVADMPRDDIAFDAPAAVVPASGPSPLHAGALVRALAMAGALQTLAAMTIGHVTERRQFGRALSAFQAVQHSLAQLAAEVAAANAAADLAADAYGSASPSLGTAIAAARARIGEAAGVAIGIAHQLHGAIGFTEEHRLHWFTTALWAWRDEFGSTAWWTRRLGAEALRQSPATYWPFVTAV